MKVAICFSGQCRALESTYLNLKQNLIDPLNADVFVYASEDDYSKLNKDCLDFFEPKLMAVVPDVKIKEEGLEAHPLQRSLQEYIQMLNSWQQANKLRCFWEVLTNIHYDYVIRTRLDIRLFEKVTPELLQTFDVGKYVYVPDFHSFACVRGFGCNDRFAVGSSENITIYSNMIDDVHQYCSENHTLHAESTLCYHLRRHEVKYCLAPIRFTRVRPGGIEMDSRLRQPVEQWSEIDLPFKGE